MEYVRLTTGLIIGTAPSLASRPSALHDPPLHLWLQWFDHPNATRAAEYVKAVRNTLSSSRARCVHFLQEPGISVPSELVACAPAETKVTVTEIEGRLTFNTWIKHVRGLHQDAPACHAIINTDIEWTAEATANLKLIPFETTKCAACVLRHEGGDGELFGMAHDAQDAWVIHSGNVPSDLSLTIPLGTMGCDNRIAYELARQGFELYNPPLLLPIIHHHSSTIRAHDREKHRIAGPYICLKPTYLSTDPDSEWMMDSSVMSKIQSVLDAPGNEPPLRIVSLPWSRLKASFEQERVAAETFGLKGDLWAVNARKNRRELHRYMQAAAKADIVALDKEDHHPALAPFAHKCLVSALPVTALIQLSNRCMLVTDTAEVRGATNLGVVIYVSDTADGAETVVQGQGMTAKVLIHVLSA